MESPAQTPLNPEAFRRSFPLIAALVTLFVSLVVLRVVLGWFVPGDGTLYLAPMLTSFFVFGAFWLTLRRQLDDNVFGELGFIYVAVIVVHTAVPAFSFLTAAFYQGGPLDQLLPEPAQLRTHLWRHVLFETGVASGYLLLRGHAKWQRSPQIIDRDRDKRALIVIAVLTVVSIMAVMALSAPVESYYENYTRFDHLPWALHKFVSLCIRMSLGLYCLLLVFLFRNYEKYKLVIPIAVAAICAHEIAYSFGARIQSLLVVLQTICLYHLTVRRISLKWGLIAVGVIVVFYSLIELVRMQDLTTVSARDVVADQGFQPSASFISVFFPGFHLYAERAAGTLPPREWPMFLSDFISLFTFGAYERYNPMDWYARNYYPQAEIPPFTLGPIADSALWGGEFDLVLRALVNGAFFSVIVRWFLRHGDQWWGLAIYVYCCAAAILTIQYSVFLDLNLVEKNLIPVLLVVHAARVLSFKRPVREALPAEPTPLA